MSAPPASRPSPWFARWWRRLFGARPPLPSSPVAEVEAAPPATKLAPKAAEAPASGSPTATTSVPPMQAPDATGHTFAPFEALADTIGTAAASALRDNAVSTLPVTEVDRERLVDSLHELTQIPALQSLVQGFTRSIGRDDADIDEVTEAISRDPALSLRVMRMANSVVVASELRVTDLPTAVHLLGVARIRRVSAALLMVQNSQNVTPGFDWRHLWMHGLATAELADSLQAWSGGTEDPNLYLGGLLHDVGKIALSVVAADAYRTVLVRTWHERLPLLELERECLGIDHREAGRIFVQSAKLAPSVVDCIAYHDAPGEADPAHHVPVAIVSLANHIAKANGLGFSGSVIRGEVPDLVDVPAWYTWQQALGRSLDAADLEADLTARIRDLRATLRTLSH